MAVDLSNLKVGDTVHIDCGGSLVVPEDYVLFPGAYVALGGHIWRMDGGYVGYQKSPFDIVAITPKPEPKRIRGWVNVYSNTTDDSYLVVFRDSREESDENKKLFDKDRRIACIYIDVAEGEGLS